MRAEAYLVEEGKGRAFILHPKEAHFEGPARTLDTNHGDR